MPFLPVITLAGRLGRDIAEFPGGHVGYGEHPADFAARTDNLAHGFGVITCRVRKAPAGSVVVDMAAGPLGGNVAGSVADETVVTENGVTLIGGNAGDHLSVTLPPLSVVVLEL